MLWYSLPFGLAFVVLVGLSEVRYLGHLRYLLKQTSLRVMSDRKRILRGKLLVAAEEV